MISISLDESIGEAAGAGALDESIGEAAGDGVGALETPAGTDDVTNVGAEGTGSDGADGADGSDASATMQDVEAPGAMTE